MRISVISFGHKPEPFEKEWMEVYQKRLKHFTKIEWHRIDSKKNLDDEDVIREIQKKTSSGTQVVLLHDAGKSWSTQDMKTWIEKQENQSKEQICFVIGGAYGFSEEILKTFPLHLSLSKFTFSHKIALLVLFEQLYRVYSWKAGTPYHHE